jgi:cyclohexanone monooxygenase
VKRDIEELIVGGRFDAAELKRRYERERDLRKRPEGTGQFRRLDGVLARFGDDPHAAEVAERPARHDHVDVTVVGAGFGGLLAGAKLREAGLERIRLVDIAGDVGGTWYWNRYPGVQCDVESYIYFPLLEEVGYAPSLKYAYGDELFAHAQNIAKRFDLYDDALLSTRVTDLAWDEQSGAWKVQTDRGDTFTSQFVVIANGNLSRPQLPGIPGIEYFEGRAFHTSRWDYEYTGGDSTGGLVGLTDKTVGIIGTGASAIQVVPHVADHARELIVFQRTPSVVVPRNNKPTDPEWAASLEPGWQRRRMENFTRILAGEIADVDNVHDSWTLLYGAVTAEQLDGLASQLGRELDSDDCRDVLELLDMIKGEQFRARIRDIVTSDNVDALLPWYLTYCKRPCFHDEYLPSFNRPNVRLIDTSHQPIQRFTGRGPVIGGTEIALDCLVFATGFEVSTSYRSQAGYDPVGRGSLTLSEKWAEGPRTLHGLQTSGFPNLFTMGIIQNASSVNFTEMLTMQAEHLAYVVAEVLRRGSAVVEVTPEGERAWLDTMLAAANPEELRRFQECTPGYINGEGDVAAAFSFYTRKFGGGTLKFVEILRRWREAGTLEGLSLRSR